MKVVIDTNVLVSAFLKPRSNPAQILRLVVQGDLDIVVNEKILSEYYEVLSRPRLDLSSPKVRAVLELIRKKGVNAPAMAKSFPLPDESDEPFLEAALATSADILITGNKKHFPRKCCKGQKVLTPKEFLSSLH